MKRKEEVGGSRGSFLDSAVLEDGSDSSAIVASGAAAFAFEHLGWPKGSLFG